MIKILAGARSYMRSYFVAQQFDSALLTPCCYGSSVDFSTTTLVVYMTLPGGGCRLQTCRGLAAQLFDSALCTFIQFRLKGKIHVAFFGHLASCD